VSSRGMRELLERRVGGVWVECVEHSPMAGEKDMEEEGTHVLIQSKSQFKT
jgi:hypothetical protein